jgi:predicted regulator of Ras-like GTPase activity (Roadblock/LC7/MglB family)
MALKQTLSEVKVEGGTVSLKQTLNELVKVDGVTTAVVVGRDGFVIDGAASRGALDAEAIGAVISTGVGSAEVMGGELTLGEMTQSMFEYNGGIIVMSLASPEAILAVVADVKANLGMVRLQVKKRLPEIARAM